MQKRNIKNENVRYKAQLVAQVFLQKFEIDYEETYSPVMDAITFRYLISLAVFKNLEMRLLNILKAYLYGSLDNHIYMKISEGLRCLKHQVQNPKSYIRLNYKYRYMR